MFFRVNQHTGEGNINQAISAAGKGPKGVQEQEGQRSLLDRQAGGGWEHFDFSLNILKAA
jgi:hypothetical protein